MAEKIHRDNRDIPERVIDGLAELGGFGVSIPEEYGGFAAQGEGEYLGMVAATEELSRGSLGVGGSLITRPEILSRALVGAAPRNRSTPGSPGWPPGDHVRDRRDRAGLRLRRRSPAGSMAKPEGNGWRIGGVKTWCTLRPAPTC